MRSELVEQSLLKKLLWRSHILLGCSKVLLLELLTRLGQGGTIDINL